MTIYNINQDNISSILPILTISAKDKADIQNAVYSGKEVMVSRDNVSLYNWTGVGYIVRDPITGSGSYMISSSLGGGSTVLASNPAFRFEQKLAMFVAGQPVKPFDKAADWFVTESIFLMALLLSIWPHYGYSPIYLVLDADAEEVKRAANHPYTWIFYYSGHAWYNDQKDYLQPEELGFVNTTDLGIFDQDGKRIGPDVKIVILNGCGSAHHGSFEGPFGVDQWHNVQGITDPQPRREVLMGYDLTAVTAMSDAFFLEFWLLMYTGLSVNEARNILIARAVLFPSLFDAWHLGFLKIFGDGGTTLAP